jgi:hypothetical protein
VVGEPVELLVRLLAPLAGEDLEVFQRRRVDRREAVGAIDAPRFFFLRPSPIVWPPGPRTASMYSSTCSAVSKYWS